MSWENVLKNKKDADWKHEMQDDMDVAEGNIMDRKEKGGNVVIYEGRGGKHGNPAEIIKEEDPKLYQKLESHFSKYPITESDKEFHWSEAFDKYGFEDGEYEELSEEVADYLIELGYKVRMTNAITHNTYIREVMWTENVKL